MPTVGELLPGAVERLRAAGSESARLDAEVLLASILRTERTALLAHPETLVGTGAVERFDHAVARRALGEPVAYIRDVKEFYGLAFGADARALIPRPETERLVEAALAAVMARLTAPGRFAAKREGGGAGGRVPLRIADVGTGGGAVIISLAVELRRRKVDLATDVSLIGTDASPDALELARENAVGHAVGDAIDFVAADLLPDGNGPFEVVVANLPYVRTGAIAGLPIAASFEPAVALDGGADGLAVIRRLLSLLPKALANDGVALLEIGADQGLDAPAAVGEVLPGWHAEIETDLAGLPRVLRVTCRTPR